MKQSWIWIVLGLQLAFFGGWALMEENHKGGQSFLLETEAVDPRDMFAGQYMTLRFPAGRLTAEQRQLLVDGSPMDVFLDPAEVKTIKGKKWEVRRASKVLPMNDDGEVLKNCARGLVQGDRVLFGIERYYFNESRSNELNALRPGSFYVQVTLNEDGRLKVQDLIY